MTQAPAEPARAPTTAHSLPSMMLFGAAQRGKQAAHDYPWRTRSRVSAYRTVS
jgi:hypothetical protein